MNFGTHLNGVIKYRYIFWIKPSNDNIIPFQRVVSTLISLFIGTRYLNLKTGNIHFAQLCKTFNLFLNILFGILLIADLDLKMRLLYYVYTKNLRLGKYLCDQTYLIQIIVRYDIIFYLGTD